MTQQNNDPTANEVPPDVARSGQIEAVMGAIQGMASKADDSFSVYRHYILKQLETHEQAIRELDDNLGQRFIETEDRFEAKFEIIRAEIDQIDNKLQAEAKEIRADNYAVQVEVAKTSAKVAFVVSIVMLLLGGLLTLVYSRIDKSTKKSPVQDTTSAAVDVRPGPSPSMSRARQISISPISDVSH
jgi:hypothetical protein